MTKSLTQSLIVATTILLITSPLIAQEPSGGRRTDFEYLEAGFDLYGFEEGPTFPGTDYWNTPEGKRRYFENKLEDFHEHVEEFSRIGSTDWLGQFSGASDRSTLKELEDQSKDLEKSTNEMIEFLEWTYDSPSLEAKPVSDQSLDERLEQIPLLVARVLPAVPMIRFDAVLDAQVFLEMRRDLVQIKALSRSLRD